MPPGRPAAETPTTGRARRAVPAGGPVERPRRARRQVGRPVASDGEERRRLIVDAARRQFARSGYLGTTNREIAEQAGITTGAIYHYFRSKLDVYLAVFEETDERILRRYHEVTSDDALSFFDKVTAVLEVSSQLNSEDQSLAAFLAAASFEAHRSDELMSSYRAHDEAMTRFFEELVDHGITEGVIAGGPGRQAALDAIRVLTLGLTSFSVRVNDPEVHRRATHAAVEALRGELFSRPPARPASRRRAAAR